MAANTRRTRRGWARQLAVAGALLVTLAGAFALWVRSLLWFPDDVTPAERVCPADAPAAPTDRPLRVLVWNLQYAGSRNHHFFYDGGEAVHVPPADVARSLERIAEVITEADPDLLLLQELDRGSDRTGRVDQLALLLQGPNYPCWAATPYHKVGYVPTPSHQHMGRVDMQLAVLSRFQLGEATRRQLPLLAEPWWRQAFNLRRAVLDVPMVLDDGRSVRLFNTHLSAFSKGDGTLGRQMAVLDALAGEEESAGRPWVLGGDLNALPPGDDPSRLGADGAWYADAETPVKVLFDRYTSVMPLAEWQRDPAARNTYVPFGEDAADRVLDYAFIARSLGVLNARVLPVYDVSDHLPLVFDLYPSPDAAMAALAREAAEAQAAPTQGGADPGEAPPSVEGTP